MEKKNKDLLLVFVYVLMLAAGHFQYSLISTTSIFSLAKSTKDNHRC